MPKSTTDDDPFQAYHAAVETWERADKDHHQASIAVACGDLPASESSKAAARLNWAEADAIIARHIAGRRWFTGLRFCTEDDELKLAVKLFVVELFHDVAEGLANQIAGLTSTVAQLKARVNDLEDVVAQGAAQ